VEIDGQGKHYAEAHEGDPAELVLSPCDHRSDERRTALRAVAHDLIVFVVQAV
jgi:hypothetical protein